jgi:Polysaccharide pyruvyl transferase
MTAQRLLLRSPTSPFDVISPMTVADRNLIATNTGNLVFMFATYRLLATPGTEITPDRMRVEPKDADRINAEYDVYVAPFANAFRPVYESTLGRWADLIERLRIPVVIPGVGAQLGLDAGFDVLRPIEATVKRFVRAVLERSPSIGVRGEVTAAYLRHLGFDAVEVIGCPSMFLQGPVLRVEKRVPALAHDSPIAITGAPYRPAMGQILAANAARYPNLVYVAQDIGTLLLLVSGRVPEGLQATPGFPDGPDHPLLREGRVRAFTHPWPWMDFLREREFTFGSRIHGNLVSLAAGTPAYVLAHDLRTLELARYFEVPHRQLPEVAADVDPAELYATADYGPLMAGHAGRWAAFEGFLDRHGLSTVFAAAGDPAAFDRRMAELRFPLVEERPPLTTRATFRIRRVARAALRAAPVRRAIRRN